MGARLRRFESYHRDHTCACCGVTGSAAGLQSCRRGSNPPTRTLRFESLSLVDLNLSSDILAELVDIYELRENGEMVNTSSLSLDGLFLESSNLSSPTKHIQKLYPACKKIYGPYLRKDGRLVIVLYDGVKRTAKQASRIIMEVHLGRVLDPSETVDHIDRNPLSFRAYVSPEPLGRK